MKYRCRKDVMAEILHIAEQKNCTMARLLSSTSVSHDQINKCLPILLKEKLLTRDKLSGEYKVAPKGLNFLTKYRSMRKIISSSTEGV
jgi:predicted transcriptional regulator